MHACMLHCTACMSTISNLTVLSTYSVMMIMMVVAAVVMVRNPTHESDYMVDTAKITCSISGNQRLFILSAHVT